ncbi:uncharacterized protein [Malus domestica]|uniref:uncharacterized protein n=1 Tax=Malus domestica TaxID=3750 RepID=UPI0010A9DED9|nr:uncharacterized protein LOC114822497 [Malus domestica]
MSRGILVVIGGNGGYGVVVREHTGKFVVAIAGPIESSVSALHSELIAAQCAVGLVKTFSSGDVKVQFEGDSSVVVVAMKGNGENYSMCGSMINDSRSFITELSNAVCSHVRREGNLATHRLAQMGIGGSQEVVWFKDPPNLLQDII